MCVCYVMFNGLIFVIDSLGMSNLGKEAIFVFRNLFFGFVTNPKIGKQVTSICYQTCYVEERVANNSKWWWLRG